MSNGPNHRRGHGHIQDNGPRWESHTPSAGCNSTHVARSRKNWKRRRARAERRAGSQGSYYLYCRPAKPLPETEVEDE